uniref:Transmembrane protein 170B n=1 Tax=Equus asinus TaxID=9793 RepID=A0A9L0JW88_EQUAS
MKAEGGDHSMINLSVQQVLSLWAHGTVLRNLTEMWYWIFLWALFSSLFVHGAAGVLMFVMLQRHRQGRVISVVAVSIGFLASVTGAMITIPQYIVVYSSWWVLLVVACGTLPQRGLMSSAMSAPRIRTNETRGRLQRSMQT